ncbi:unnamed protein product [Rhizoctonia solani]|uniref:BTB domain-containing protein n=1 Tax=Rhizoctonia solani TaxID=456999 RepID=A0A8H3BHH7_9AGAM|nr:unnamed protein product [Rhizoctonia solani]
MFPYVSSTPRKNKKKRRSTVLTSQSTPSLFVDEAPNAKPNEQLDEIDSLDGKEKPGNIDSQDEKDKSDKVNSDEVEKPDGESDTECSGPPERHPEFFFDNTLVAVQAGRTLFNVHKYQLAKSEVFSERFKTSKAEGDEPGEGSSPEYPIKLKSVSSSEFTALLRVLYASHFSSHQPTSDASLVIPAFRLDNLFRFSELRTFLLPLAEKTLNDIDKIIFARQFGIKQWLVPSHVRLCQRDESLTGAEARKLGVESILIVTRLREQHRVRSSGSTFGVGSHYCSSCAGMTYTGSYHRREQGGNSTTNSNAIESELKKWVESGCIVKD